MDFSQVPAIGKLPKCEFTMSLPNIGVSKLIIGKLKLFQQSGDVIKYNCTSGLPNHQTLVSQSAKGRGPIPSCKIVGIKNWVLHTNRLWQPGVKGIEGSCYLITPLSIAVGQIRRGEFMIHWDANAPGSAGCIVFQIQQEWDSFRHLMQVYFERDITRIPLFVDY